MNNILIIGSGGRESAMINALLHNKQVRIYCYAQHKQLSHKSVSYTIFSEFSIDKCKEICQENFIDYVIIGSEQYLNTDIVDELESLNIKCICPNKKMANIETSKTFARNLIKYSSLKVFNPDFLAVNHNTSFYSIINFLNKWNDSVVVKADGLHGGKGVKVYNDHLFNRDDILNYIHEILKNEEKVVLEQKLEGKEFSFISITDGKTTVDCPPIQDFKRLMTGNKGPNTGSMGCISDKNKLNFLTVKDILTVSSINRDVVNLLNTYDTCYKGFLYGSYIKTNKGEIKIIEFNARLGDPEGITIMEQLDMDFFKICESIGNKELHLLNIRFKNTPSLCTYLVPVGYPEDPIKNFSIDLSDLTRRELSHIHLASISNHTNRLVGKGSRALAVYYQGGSHEDNHDFSMALICKIMNNNPGKFHYRSDLCELYTQSRVIENVYLASGVNVDEGNKVVSDITPLVRETYNENVLNSIGSFGGCYGLRGVISTFEDPVLVSSIDGVGTKSILTLDHLKDKGFYNLGIDIVNHCINDVLVQGATPLYFLDYIASSKVKSEQVKEFVMGIVDACKDGNCALLGGETAEMPNIYEKDKHDFVGCMTGVVDRSRIIDGKANIQNGTILMALPSSGPHTNGYSLIRKLKKEHPHAFTDDLLNQLCVPHRSYLHEIRILQDNGIDIQGLCHITGGGFDDNISRVLPENAKVIYNNFEFSELFKELQRIGNIDIETMKKVFNCGYGMIIFIDEISKTLLENLLPEVKQIGTIEIA